MLIAAVKKKSGNRAGGTFWSLVFAVFMVKELEHVMPACCTHTHSTTGIRRGLRFWSAGCRELQRGGRERRRESSRVVEGWNTKWRPVRCLLRPELFPVDKLPGLLLVAVRALWTSYRGNPMCSWKWGKLEWTNRVDVLRCTRFSLKGGGNRFVNDLHYYYYYYKKENQIKNQKWCWCCSSGC